MNINLIYQQTGYSFQISVYTCLSFIYDVTNKVFKIPLQSIELHYKDQIIPNNQTNASSYFNQFPVSITVIDKSKTNIVSSLYSTPSQERKSSSFDGKKRKKNYIRCQICHHKNSIFYCRDCNNFICFECNIRYPEHFEHLKINLESGNILESFEEYRAKILDQLNELNSAFQATDGSIIDDDQRTDVFFQLNNAISDLDKKTKTLTIMSTSYSCDSEMLTNFNKTLRELQAPKSREEGVKCFNEVNEKELEMRNYIPFINLHIIKSEFNNKMTRCFQQLSMLLNDLINDVNNKLDEANKLKEMTINDIILFNKQFENITKKVDTDTDSDSSSSNSDSESDSNNNNQNIILPKIKSQNEINNLELYNNQNKIIKTENSCVMPKIKINNGEEKTKKLKLKLRSQSKVLPLSNNINIDNNNNIVNKNTNNYTKNNINLSLAKNMPNSNGVYSERNNKKISFFDTYKKNAKVDEENMNANENIGVNSSRVYYLNKNKI